MFAREISSIVGNIVLLMVVAISVPSNTFADEISRSNLLVKHFCVDRVDALVNAPHGARIPIIVEFEMAPLTAGTSASEQGEADAVRAAAIRDRQKAILERVFDAQTGAGAAGANEAKLKLMPFSPQFAMHATPQQLVRIADDPLVTRIHEDKLSEPLLHNTVSRLQMPLAYSQGASGKDYHVAVLDTGARRSHVFLDSRITHEACFSTEASVWLGEWVQSSSLCEGSAGHHVGNGSANDCDEQTISGCGHGTHVAGIAAGYSNPVLNTFPAHGIARQAQLFPVNVFSRLPREACGSLNQQYTQGCVRSWVSDQIAALNHIYEYRQTLDIAAVNMSFGDGEHIIACTDDPRRTIIASLRQSGLAPIAAAGNNSYRHAISAPACIPEAIAVGGSDKLPTVSIYTNWNPLIDLAGPGLHIRSSITKGDSNVDFNSNTGTSQAAAHVSGAIAALRSAVPSATIEEVLTALMETGTPISSAEVTRPFIRVADALAALGGSEIWKAQMTFPETGTTLPAGGRATFQWSAGSNVTAYRLDIGTNGLGSTNILSEAIGEAGPHFREVTGLPTDGSSTVYVRLSSRISGVWQFNDYTYTAGGGAVKAEMTSPTPGATLTDTSATFTWTSESGVGGYWLYVGTQGTGSANIFSGGGAQTSRTVSGLPASGTLNVRLMSYISGGWQFNDYTYTMNAATKAVMTSPTPGSTITNTSATFNWTAGSGATGYWLYVGSNGAGSANIFSGGGAPTSRTVSGLPASGTLNVRLMSYISGGWQFNDYTYTMNAATKAVMTWPAPGSTLTNPWASFQWTSVPGSSGYWLMVGTNGAGSANILSAGSSVTLRSVTGLPQVGTLNVRLMTYISGGWQFNDYSYTMAVPAMMATPAPGSTLQGQGVMFQWTGHASIGSYWLYVGTNGPGSANIFSSGVTNTWRWVGGIPASGTVHVRLMSWVGGAWRFRDYTYNGGTGSGMALEAVGAEEFSSLMQPVSLE